MYSKEAIKGVMKTEGITQRALAEMLGIDYRALNYMLGSQYDLKMEKFKFIMECLGYRMEIVKDTSNRRRCCEEYLEKVRTGIAPTGRYYCRKEDGTWVGIIRELSSDRLDLREKTFNNENECREWLTPAV